MMGVTRRRPALSGRCVLVPLLVLAPVAAFAGDDGDKTDSKTDTQFIFGFTAGTGTGEVGERELEHQTIGQWGKTGQYAALSDQLRIENAAFENFRFEVGLPFTYFHVAGVNGFDDRDQGSFNGVASEFRYRLLDGTRTPFALTIGAEPTWNRTDEVSGAPVNSYGSEITVALDRELVAGRLFGALNLIYDPEVLQSRVTGAWAHESTGGAAVSVTTQLWSGGFVGGEVRYLRKYDGLGFDSLLGQALFIGPNTYIRLSKALAISAAWSIQVAGHATSVPGPLDLTSFTRQQAMLRVEYNF
jgi:hypothetical protein